MKYKVAKLTQSQIDGYDNMTVSEQVHYLSKKLHEDYSKKLEALHAYSQTLGRLTDCQKKEVSF